MVYVYGGGFNVGSTQDKTFDGSIYADEEDVVLVSSRFGS
jgi:carboxylesterase type B